MLDLTEISIGDIIGDLECIDVIKKRHDGKYKYISRYYIMRCLKCGRCKEMLFSTIKRGAGIDHKSCGKGIKTQDPIFYSRWQAMRTRTTNLNYDHADRYINRGIKSDVFELFIDFFDLMYDSFRKKADEIGANNTSLERIDINEDYTPENCKWIDKHDQPKNTCRSVKFKVTYPDGKIEISSSVNTFAKEHDIHPSCIRDCLNGRSNTAKGFKFERL